MYVIPGYSLNIKESYDKGVYRRAIRVLLKVFGVPWNVLEGE